MKPLLTCCWLTFALVLFAAADTPAPKNASVIAEGAKIGLVWKIEGGKSPVYLAGSLHILRKEDLPPPAPMQTAYEASEQLWFEIPPGQMEDPTTRGKILSLATLPADKTLQDLVPAKTFKKVQEWEGDPALKLILNRTRPWFAAITIMMFEYQEMGISGEHGIEKFYQRQALNDKKATGGFETAEEQINFFSQLTDEQQAEILDQTFDEITTAKTKINEMIAAWQLGQADKLAEQIEESFKNYPDLKKLLLDDRNTRWVPEIEKLLAGDKPTLVIVGAAHLTGKNSVNELLEKKGWKLTRLKE